MKELMEALLRIEKKLDETLKLVRSSQMTLVQPMDSEGQVCQLCQQPVEYNKEQLSGNVWRSCGCRPNLKES